MKIESTRVVDLSDDVARAENMEKADDLRAELLKYYPDMKTDSSVAVVHFELIEELGEHLVVDGPKLAPFNPTSEEVVQTWVLDYLKMADADDAFVDILRT